MVESIANLEVQPGLFDITDQQTVAFQPAQAALDDARTHVSGEFYKCSGEKKITDSLSQSI